MENKKKVFVLVPPATGHVNPISGLVYELSKKNNNIHVVFYGNEENRQTIERTGAEYRPYVDFDFEKNMKAKPLTENKDNSMLDLINNFMDASYKLLPALIQDVDREKPDLILYDIISLPAKYLVNYYSRKAWSPKSLMFMPSLVVNKQIIDDVPGFLTIDLKKILQSMVLFVKQFIFSLTFGLNIFNPIGFMLSYDKRLNIVSVMRELQPRIELFDETFKFVGPCLSDARKTSHIEPQLAGLLDNKNILIYASLGTIFNNNLYIFESIIKSVRTIDGLDSEFQNLKLIISLGDEMYEKFEAKIKHDKYSLPPNVYLFRKVPQLDVLKHASLFITHSGMNSTSEAIQYGVPMISIPLNADQPIVANRICDQLELGIRISPFDVTADLLAQTIYKILTDPKYKHKISQFSKISSKYNGSVTAANLVTDILN